MYALADCTLYYKYSFHRKRGLRLAAIYAYQINHCTFQKPTLKSPLVDFKPGCEWWASHHSLLEIQ